MSKNIILTGDRPTGNLHIGHYVGSLRKRVELQNSGKYESFIMIADAQALTDNAETPEKVRDNVLNVALDYLAVGLDPKKSTIFIQSQIPELTELTFFYSNLVTVARLQRNPTVKSEIEQKEKFKTGVPVGFFTYPISQAADITAFNATVVPVGEDQLPMLEQTREIVHKFNSLYGETLIMPNAMVPENSTAARLPGIDGNSKMGKSLGNAIYLCDDAETIAAKVKTMFTDPKHLRVEDPGNTTDNTVFIYLSIFATPEHFATFLPEYKNYDELTAHYERGGLGDVKVKKFLNEVLQETLRPIRERREKFAKDPKAVMEMLQNGSIAARKVAFETTERVKRAMKLNYFN
ncbi:MAG: tryptophan--tRNA ligase [Alphaproteobacteria bacterium]|nr:tryptophan--tRNA ligase [Alphaproteobacteria bacterium]MBN2674872.1 tryptophan--tRNA ligase [Alphaproteobacteria bacterium]